jgi:ADP-heptose:LPS heptosyltransferase
VRELEGQRSTLRSRRLERPGSIIVIRALQLGDMLCAVPALRALRHAFPRARVTLAGLPWAREFTRRFSRYIDDFLEFPGYPGLPERECDVRRVPEFLATVQARRYDLALQLHGSGQLLNPITALFGARQCAGYYDVKGGYRPDPDRFFAWRAEEHEIVRYVRLMRELGIVACDTTLEFPIGDDDREAWLDITTRFGFDPSRYVCIHPGSQLPSRRWEPERFAETADRLTEEGYQVVVTGTARERPLISAVMEAMREPAIDVSGATSLGALAVLIEHARLLIANDTGVSHIAAAVRTPSVIICCGSDFRRWAPLDDTRHRILHYPVECRPCSYAACPIGHPCATGVRTDVAMMHARRLLAQNGNRNVHRACAR